MRLGRFVEREEAERTPAWKQWIPYCMLRCGDWSADGAPDERGVLLVQRTKKGGEARLHESWTVGLGGHIEPCDATAGDTPAPDAEAFFHAALQRELAEAQRLVGIREISKIRGGFTHLVESAKLWQTRSQFESWSQFLIQAEIVGAMGGRSWSGSTSAEGGSGPES